jgi:hypothetical protein
MPEPRREWTADDVAKLKSLAGRLPTEEIAVQLGRSPSAIAVKACNLKLSLRHRAKPDPSSGETTLSRQ